MADTAEKPFLTLTRQFRAPPAKVWQAFTDPQVIRRWFGVSDEYSVTLAEADVRVGGRYRIRMEGPQRDPHEVGGVYREVIPARRLVFTWAWVTTPDRESLVTVELRAANGGTELSLKHEKFFDDEARDRHQQGWAAGLARMETVVAAVG